MRYTIYNRITLLLVATIILLSAALIPAPVLAQSSTPPAPGTIYVVTRGDTWTSISRQTGVPIASLKIANPQAIHPRDWLYEGERLQIPVPNAPATSPERTDGYWYQVRTGDSWSIVAQKTGVSVETLWQANPSRLYPGRWLYTGQWLWIPGNPPPAAAPAQPPVTATLVATLAPTPTATAIPTATSTSTPFAPTPDGVTPADAAQAAATVAAAAESAATVVAAAGSAATVVAAANTIATAAAAAQAAATSIAAFMERATIVAGADVIQPATPVPFTPTPTASRTRAATSTRAATATPIPTRAATATPIPTRTATATPIPTRVATATPTPVPMRTGGACLLDKVISANRAFDRWGQDGFLPAVTAYRDVLDDVTSKACTKVAGELDLLRDYARYRLIVAYIGAGQAAQAEPLRGQIKNTAIRGAADTFLDGLKSSGSIVQACRDTTAYATSEPASWRWLIDLGVPTKPADLCPLG